MRRSALRIATAAAAAGLLAFGFASSAGAAGTLDQAVPGSGSAPGFSNWFWFQQMAQTFTAGRSGQLDRVALFEGASGVPSTTPTGPAFTLQIWTVDTSKATLTAKGTPASYAFQSWTGTNNWHNFDLSPAVQVTAGTQYAIVIRAVRSFTVRWSYMTGYSYPGGGQWTCCDLSGKWMAGVSGTDFAFQTYVTGGTASNTPPTVSAAQPALQPNEGTTPSNTGNYADPDGDSVALSASAGSLTRTGTSTGTWSWAQPASDEAPAETVTITANDGHNALVTTQFTVTVVEAAPTVTINSTQPAVQTGAATSTPEGTALSFSGSAHSASAADNQAGFTYAWSVTKDGAPYAATGTGTSFTFTPTDEGAYVITLSASDAAMTSGSPVPGTATVSANVSDVLPTASIDNVAPSQSALGLILPNESISFSGSFKDPGTADPHTASWDFGDGSPAATGWAVTHSFANAGAYSVTLTVSQGEDPGVGTATYLITVQTPAQALGKIAGYVNGLSDLNAGQKNSLIAKLNAAGASASRGDYNTASNQLDAFLNEVRADGKTGKLTTAEADNLTNAAHMVKGALGTYNRFLEWWPLGL